VSVPVSKQLLNQIADRLTRTIPQPAKKVARTKQSWRTLKLGQRLLLRREWFRPGLRLPVGTPVTISKVDSLGILLTHISELGTLSELRWTDPEWQGMFEKAGRKKSGKKEES
jgi:hypothetical protein